MRLTTCDQKLAYDCSLLNPYRTSGASTDSQWLNEAKRGAIEEAFGVGKEETASKGYVLKITGVGRYQTVSNGYLPTLVRW